MKSVRLAHCLLAAIAAVTVLAVPSPASADGAEPRQPASASQSKRKPKARAALSAAAKGKPSPRSERPAAAPDAPLSEPEAPSSPAAVAPAAARGSAAPRVDQDSGIDHDPSPRRIALGGLLGYASSRLNLGIGARGGYTLPNDIYLGGTFVYQLGSSDDIPSVGKVGASALYGGFEGGYELHAGPVMIRPYGGLGPAVAFASGPGGSDSNVSLGLWFGGAAEYVIPKSPAFVGADMRLLFTTAGGDASVGFFLGGGVRL